MFDYKLRTYIAMKKREFVNVDEEAIKRMIAGDMPPYTTKESERLLTTQANNSLREPAGNAQTSNGTEHPRPDTAVNGKDGSMGRPSRRKKVKGDYSETFLVQCRNMNHKQTSLLLGEDIYYAVKKVLRIAGDGDLTMTGFVNNVLRHHFREYKEEISELKKNFITDISKEEEEEL